MDIAQAIYEMTYALPKAETYALISQMQRAAVSIPSNIAEGAGRDSNKDFSHFISIALGSLFELHTQIVLSERIGYIDNNQKNKILNMTNELQKMLVGFRKKLDNSTHTI